VYKVRPEVLEVSKALGEDTRFAIFSEIANAATPLTVKDLVAMFGMHHSAIRIHLNKLEEAGLIVSHKLHQKGAVGRPQLAFRANPTTMTMTLPPRDYQMLAELAIGFTRSMAHTEHEMNAFGEQWGGDYARTRGIAAKEDRPLDASLRMFRDELEGMGILSTWDAINGGGTLGLANCPFGELAARNTPTVCALHRSVMRGMFEQISGTPIHWDQRACQADGDPGCVIDLHPRAAKLQGDQDRPVAP
jgi:predicted ArsR family transcriptional regulator